MGGAMTELHLDTAAFRVAKPPKAGRRERKAARLPRRAADVVVAQDLGGETVRVAFEVKAHQGGLVIVVETSDDDEGWLPVAPELLKEGLTAILQRESLLERTAA